MDDYLEEGWTNGDIVCKNCKHIVPHVHQYIDNEWVYSAKCVKRSESGGLFTIPDRNTYTCEKFEKGSKFYEKSD